MYNGKDMLFLATNWIWYNQFAKYFRILFWILTQHTQHACFELFFEYFMEFCTHVLTVVPRPFLAPEMAWVRG